MYGCHCRRTKPPVHKYTVVLHGILIPPHPDRSHDRVLTNQTTAMATMTLTPEDYKIYIGIVDKSVHRDPAEYVVSLHKLDRTVCQLFFAPISRKNPSGPRAKAVETWGRHEASHRHCNNLRDKKFVAHLRYRDFRLFCKCFESVQSYESQFTMFRFLWRCVDEGILKGEQVWSVKPNFEFGPESRRYIDCSR